MHCLLQIIINSPKLMYTQLPTPTLQQQTQQLRHQNQTHLTLSQQTYTSHNLSLIPISKTQHPDLSSKYQGYLQIAKRKLSTTPSNEYFSSPFLRQLKEKRNNMFSDEIIEKMIKQYGIKEYGTFVGERSYLPVNGKGEKFGSVEVVGYEELEKRMTKG